MPAAHQHLQQAVDNYFGEEEDFIQIFALARIFPTVVSHESGWRNRRTLLTK
jgi:hypothetical protein